MFKKILVGIATIIALFFFFAKTSFAEEFITDVTVDYSVGVDGKTTVNHRVTLENATSDLYATAYTLSLESIEPQNVSAYDSDNQLAIEQKNEGNKTLITVRFGEAVVGLGKSRTFTIAFENFAFAVRTGEVWEVSIPRLSKDSSFRSYTANLSIPNSLGNEAYVSPNPDAKQILSDKTIYTFSKESISKTGITAGFGAFQVFSFTLHYHLENPLSKKANIEIALPPDTALQRVYYQLINPKPLDVYLDEDGNWIALFSLASRERIDVEARGSVQIFAGVRPFPKSTEATLKDNLKESEYWQVNDPKIIKLANELRTPKAIYDYVSQNLTYDYSRVRPNVERLGALKALENPTNAICMEFTDVFVALARAAGIPAREVNGFAYTENPEIQPLSLVADVLHAWPEYWDEAIGSWVPVDPTWASTTGGIDYFSKLDLRHFTFVNHGKDPTRPFPPGSYKLGPNPQKDVFVSFGQLPEMRTSELDINIEARKSFPFSSGRMKVTVVNNGPVALYSLQSNVLFDTAVAQTDDIEVLPPFGHENLEIVVPFSFLGKNTPGTVTVNVLDKSISVPTYKNQVIIYNLLAIFLVLGMVTIASLIKLKKLKIGPVFTGLKKFFTKNKDEDQFRQSKEIQNSQK